LAGLGLLAACGLVGFQQALVAWPERRATFDSFHGEDTLIGRAAARWETYGTVAVDPGLGRSDLTIDTVRRYRLDPRRFLAARARLRASSASRGQAPRVRAGRVVGVRDAWGRDSAIVVARRS
jgi:hypothetical protein